jgi:hypothetical protein
MNLNRNKYPINIIRDNSVTAFICYYSFHPDLSQPPFSAFVNKILGSYANVCEDCCLLRCDAVWIGKFVLTF